MNSSQIEADTAEEGAQIGLLALMLGLSEECWCAGWMSGMEYNLWQVRSGTRFGMGIITERQATLLRLLSEEAGGWWVLGGDYTPQFLTTTAWTAKLEEEGRGSHE